ncbi:MAG: hypothetical protein EZS28_008092 [Streblomastix strix]|uniref:Uncharacterized protein n=1 Tax=Streblomastix strix TaxID=222440 RepID=A0A5J4WPS2_9EUKA|nr:MAG: hypothetical protein EZS28_008092 [Streblomastix strix]
MTVPKEYNIIDGLPGLGPDIMLELLSEFRLISNAVQFLDPDYVEFLDIDGIQKKINQKEFDNCINSLIQVLNNGIWSLEVMFQNTYGNAAVGIVRDSYDIPARAHYANKLHTNHIAAFCPGYLYPVYYKGQGTDGNANFKNNQIVRLEFDSFKGTLILFIDNVQQPVYFSGIEEKVRFIVYMYYDKSSCTILSLKKLIAPTSKHIENEVAIKW